MAETVFNDIRLSLKYDTLSNWNLSTIILKPGEVGIAELTTNKVINGDTAQTPDNTPPAIAMKVGNGSSLFKDLPWVQAVAGDVYAWAKAATKPEYQASEIKNLSTYINNTVVDTDTQYKIVLNGSTVQLMSKSKGQADTAYTLSSSFELPTYTLTSGSTNGTVSFNGTEVPVKGLKSAAYTDSSAYATAAQGTKANTAVQTIQINSVEQTKTNGIINLPAYPTLSSLGAAKATDVSSHINNKENPHQVTAAQVGLGKVTNNAQVKGLASGTTSGHLVSWGADGYTVADSGKSISDFATAAQGTKADNAMPKSGGTFTGAVSGIAPTADANLTTKAYVDAQIKANAASVFKFKGTVDTVAKLPTASAELEGHVYHVSADHGEYVCAKVDGATSYTWEPLGGVVDLSAYALSASVIQRVSGATGYVPKFNADGTLSSTGFTIGTSVPANAVFTDTKVSNVSNSTGKVFTGLSNNTTISTTDVGALVLTGFSASTSTTGSISASDTITAALNKLYNLANSKTSNTGTVTSVAVSNGGGLKVTGSPITSSGTITITHGDKPTSGTATTNSGRTYIQNITLDAYGHVASVSTATETVVDTGITSVATNNGLTQSISGRKLTLGISSISTDLLVQGTNTIVLDCGTSAV